MISGITISITLSNIIRNIASIIINTVNKLHRFCTKATSGQFCSLYLTATNFNTQTASEIWQHESLERSGSAEPTWLFRL